MEKNFTPLNIDALYPQKKGNKSSENISNTIFVLLVTLTALVIAVVLFIIIQKKVSDRAESPFHLPVLGSVEAFHG